MGSNYFVVHFLLVFKNLKQVRFVNCKRINCLQQTSSLIRIVES